MSSEEEAIKRFQDILGKMSEMRREMRVLSDRYYGAALGSPSAFQQFRILGMNILHMRKQFGRMSRYISWETKRGYVFDHRNMTIWEDGYVDRRDAVQNVGDLVVEALRSGKIVFIDEMPPVRQEIIERFNALEEDDHGRAI